MIPSPRRSLSPVWKFVGAVAGGLVAGAGAAHLIYTQSHRFGLELRPQRPAPALPKAPTPEALDAIHPGRGRLARRPAHIPRKGWIDIGWRVANGYFSDQVGFVAGGVTFLMLLSLFPTLAAFVTVYGLFADPADAPARLAFLYSFLPANVAGFLGQEMTRLAAGSTGSLTFTLIWTLALSLWTANNGIKTLFHGINVAYHEVEKRDFIQYNLLCFAFTLSGLAAILLSAALVLGVPIFLGLFGLADDWERLAPLRWPLLFALYVLTLVAMYRFGPSRTRARIRWLVPGAVFAASVSVFISFAFSWYLTTFVRMDSYGPLATAMGFLLWVWLSVQVVLMGAKLNAEIEHQTAIDTTIHGGADIGARGATMADTVGAPQASREVVAFTRRQVATAGRVLGRRPPRA
ncbi:YihY/virulence factor BrkB family protein [Brevundimonas sp. AJA228-03]|uniref:YihY/virulence factor BrkB family protein n=1 Tax=Brevundimonas sp. AJA228-03 TaxID=2752515 RepID=UPI001AE0BB97|nr:YihY/virulence factor BrkB family protein [Brevundimonas sp. AJA228-03]QTN20081.1 YihY/virulence factor BrkB family protein [Brevundimonas sp. AJA228-03]